jgi:pyridoxal 5'-phosphate synthase pdxS subunit
MRRLTVAPPETLMAEAKALGAPFELLTEVAKTGKLPVPNFAAGGVATPADAALLRLLGAEAVFVGSGIFKSHDPKSRARAIVEATTYYDQPEVLARVSEDLPGAMEGLDIRRLDDKELLQSRGW